MHWQRKNKWPPFFFVNPASFEAFKKHCKLKFCSDHSAYQVLLKNHKSFLITSVLFVILSMRICCFFGDVWVGSWHPSYFLEFSCLVFKFCLPSFSHVSIWLLFIQEEIRHSFIHSVALDAIQSEMRWNCFQQQLRNVAFLKNKNKNSLTLGDMFCSILINPAKLVPS